MKALKIVVVIFIFFIVNMSTAQDDREKQTKRFQVIDTNGNEVITMDEMITFYRGKKDRKGNPIDAIVIFHGMDTNNNGIVTFQEFQKGVNWKEGKKEAQAISQKKGEKIEKPKKTKYAAMTAKEKRIARFKKIDVDNNKVITLNEMVAHYKGQTNKKGKPVESEVMFYGLDKNKNNKVTLSEFLEKVNWRLGRERVKAIKNKAD